MPHDVEGLIGCFGGKEAFTGKLDSLFVVSSVLEGAASPDISGLIGQYAHGNEPSHHVVYLYTMIGQPWKTADKVREILTTLYHDRPDGLSGNEDVGQMSAWYVLSSLGFYQVEACRGRYFFGSPLFDKAEVRVRDGVLTVTAHNNSAANKYIQAVKLNGKPYTKPYIAFDDIAAGGVLESRWVPNPQCGMNSKHRKAMKKGYIAFAALCAAALASCTCPSAGGAAPPSFGSTFRRWSVRSRIFSLSTGNTYPAIALPWGMNFWTPQTGKMGDGWAYILRAHQVRGFKQTHQPSPWINDYGRFRSCPCAGG